MMTDDAARLSAESLLDVEVRPGIDDEVVLIDSDTVRKENFWVFFYTTRTHLETKSLSHALAGNGPIIVSARDGTARHLSSASPWEDQV